MLGFFAAQVVLKESAKYDGFRMRLVAPLMGWKPRKENFAYQRTL